MGDTETDESNIGVHEEENPMSCEECGRIFYKSHYLKNHIIIAHKIKAPKKIMQISCMECDQSFVGKITLKRHIIAVHDPSCKECGKTFANRTYLKMHRAQVHEQTTQFSCVECGKSFVQRSHLKEHIETVHERKMPFSCGECNKGFAHKGNWKRHIQSHMKKPKKRARVRSEAHPRAEMIANGSRDQEDSFLSMECAEIFPQIDDLSKYMEILENEDELEDDHQNACAESDTILANKENQNEYIQNYEVNCQNEHRQEDEVLQCTQTLTNSDFVQENAFFSSGCGEIFSQLDDLSMYTEIHQNEHENQHRNEDSDSVDSEVIPGAEIYGSTTSNILPSFAAIAHLVTRT